MSESKVLVRAAHVADALDAVGMRYQCLPAHIQALSGHGTMLGRALPVTAVRVEEVPEDRYVGLLGALDALGRDDVFVMSAQGRDDVAIWGELVSTAARARGAAGAVLDGFVRDTELVQALDYPVFARGRLPADIHGRLDVTGHGQPIRIGDVDVERGSLIVGDIDGVVVVPPLVEEEVMERAREKAQAESGFREAVIGGMSPSAAFEEYGVL